MPPFRGKVNEVGADELATLIRTFDPTYDPTAARRNAVSADEFRKRFRQLEAEMERLKKQFRELSEGSADRQRPGRPDSSPRSAPSKPSAPAAAETSAARELFRQHCVKCHGADGTGSRVRRRQPTIPDFTDPAWQARRSDAQLLASVLDGKGAEMPSWRGKIDEEQARGLVAFRWTVTGGYQLLGDLGGGTSTADAASFDGSVVVGESPPKGAIFGSFRWTAAQGMMAVPVGFPNAVTDDGTMVAGGNAWWMTSGQTGNFGGGPCTSTQIPLRMVDLSADGSVAAGSGKGGLDMFGQPAANAYRSTPTGNCQDIDPVFNRNSDASGISADGSTIVGEAQDSQGHYRAFRWTAATGMVDLGTLGGGNLLSNATAASRDGSVVVGYSLTTSSSGSDHAFIWTTKTGMQDLNTLLKGKIPKGWILQVATDVSEDGAVITGFGISPPPKGSSFGTMEPWRIVLSSTSKSAPALAVPIMAEQSLQDGTSWSVSPGPNPAVNQNLLHGVTARSDGTVAAVGHQEGVNTDQPLILMNAASAPAAAPMAAARAAPATTAGRPAAAPTLPAPPDTAAVDQLFAADAQADQPGSLAGHRAGRPRPRTPIGMAHRRHVVVGSDLISRFGPESSSRLEPS
jgi:probable HAF family extracellular repeat protein